MQRIKSFFVSIWLSLTKPSHYRRVLTGRTGSAIGYLFWLLLITSFITSVILAVGIFAFGPLLRTGISELKAVVPTLYPAELVVTLKDGRLSTNAPGATMIPFPERWRAALDDNEEMAGLPKNLLVIDTAATVEDYSSKDTVVLATERAVVYPGKSTTSTGPDGQPIRNMEMQFRTFEDMEDMQMTRAVYDNFVSKALPFADAAPGFLQAFAIALIVVLPFVFAGFLLLWHLAYLAVATLVLWVIAAVLGRKLGYGQLYRLGLVGLTVPLVVSLFTPFIGLTFPFLFSLIFFVWMGVVIAKLPARAVSKKA